MGTLFGIKAFAVAILGGIGNAWGVVVAGLIYGVAEALIIALAGSTYSQITTFTLVILALALRPNGLFGRAEVRDYVDVDAILASGRYTEDDLLGLRRVMRRPWGERIDVAVARLGA